MSLPQQRSRDPILQMERKGSSEPRRLAMRARTTLGLFTAFMAILVFVTVKLQFEHMQIESLWPPLSLTKRRDFDRFGLLNALPRGIVESTSDMMLKPLWHDSKLKVTRANYTALLAMPVGIKQKKNVDRVVRKFLAANCSVMLFHYDGKVDGWHDLEWSDKAIHVLARNQTKWWFAKRFLHPDVVSSYDYVFLWDEDLGVENFHPGRYLHIMVSEGLEISQPALDPDQSEIHHRITIRNKTGKVHRRIYEFRGSLNCSDESKGPPCTGLFCLGAIEQHLHMDSDYWWVEGMAPVFSRAAWQCVWHLIQNDLIHGWGLDMKLGYCAQGDRTKNVGVIDSEFIVHKGIPSLGGSSTNKDSSKVSSEHSSMKAPSERSIDSRSQIRRQSTAELKIFRKRWDQAVREDDEWIDPFRR